MPYFLVEVFGVDVVRVDVVPAVDTIPVQFVTTATVGSVCVEVVDDARSCRSSCCCWICQCQSCSPRAVRAEEVGTAADDTVRVEVVTVDSICVEIVATAAVQSRWSQCCLRRSRQCRPLLSK